MNTPLDELIDRYLLADSNARRSTEQAAEAEQACINDSNTLALAMRNLGEAANVGNADGPEQRLFALGGNKFLRVWATFDGYGRPETPRAEIIIAEEIPSAETATLPAFRSEDL